MKAFGMGFAWMIPQIPIFTSITMVEFLQLQIASPFFVSTNSGQ
jgi:hypothetical protein